ncbi:FIVAR domain-containing protein, partial [[Clostridium] saccharogumia]|nr:FIVAR domain-containing protein [Thomasclavelia saccharogumia]
DENALESDVNEALNNLTEVIGNLVLRADKTRLQEAYDMVDGLDKSLYTEGSVANLAESMANAKAVLDDSDATQEAVDAAYEALIRAYLDLRLI